MQSGLIGMVISGVVGGGLAFAATLGTVATMSAAPDPQQDQAAVVQYADE